LAKTVTLFDQLSIIWIALTIVRRLGGECFVCFRIDLLFLTLFFVTTFMGVLIWKPWSEALRTAFFDCATLVPAGLMAVLGVLYAGRKARSSTGYFGWVLMGIAGFAYFIGQCIWTYYEVVIKIEAPFPSWADAGYLVAELFFTIGVFVLFSSRPVMGRVRLLMDSAIAMTSVGALSWYLIMGKLWNQSSTSLLGKLIGVAYPFLDAIALYGVVVLYCSLQRKSTMQRSIALVAGGVASIVLADSCYLFYTLDGSYQTGTWLEAGWTLGLLLCANGLWLQLKSSSQENEAEALCDEGETAGSPFGMAVRLLLPYVFAAAALASFASYDLKNYGRISLSIIAWGCVLVALVVVRQVLTIIENQHLAQQVSSLLNFNKAINNTLDVSNVLSVRGKPCAPVDGCRRRDCVAAFAGRTTLGYRSVSTGPARQNGITHLSMLWRRSWRLCARHKRLSDV
jgi:hypothetical protein